MKHLKTYEADGITPEYFKVASEYEIAFRGILRHVKSVFPHVPEGFDTEAPIEELLKACNPRPAYGRFDVYSFQVGRHAESPLDELASEYGVPVDDSTALIAFGSFAPMSGAGAIHKYDIQDNEEPIFNTAFMQTLS